MASNDLVGSAGGGWRVAPEPTSSSVVLRVIWTISESGVQWDDVRHPVAAAYYYVHQMEPPVTRDRRRLPRTARQ